MESEVTKTETAALQVLHEADAAGVTAEISEAMAAKLTEKGWLEDGQLTAEGREAYEATLSRSEEVSEVEDDTEEPEPALEA